MLVRHFLIDPDDERIFVIGGGRSAQIYSGNIAIPVWKDGTITLGYAVLQTDDDLTIIARCDGFRLRLDGAGRVDADEREKYERACMNRVDLPDDPVKRAARLRASSARRFDERRVMAHQRVITAITEARLFARLVNYFCLNCRDDRLIRRGTPKGLLVVDESN